MGDMAFYAWQGGLAIGRIELLASVTCQDVHNAIAYVAASRILRTRARDHEVEFTGETRIVVLDEIQESLVWCDGEGGHVTVLKPWSQL